MCRLLFSSSLSFFSSVPPRLSPPALSFLFLSALSLFSCQPRLSPLSSLPCPAGPQAQFRHKITQSLTNPRSFHVTLLFLRVTSCRVPALAALRRGSAPSVPPLRPPLPRTRLRPFPATSYLVSPQRATSQRGNELPRYEEPPPPPVGKCPCPRWVPAPPPPACGEVSPPSLLCGEVPAARFLRRGPPAPPASPLPFPPPRKAIRPVRAMRWRGRAGIVGTAPCVREPPPPVRGKAARPHSRRRKCSEAMRSW